MKSMRQNLEMILAWKTPIILKSDFRFFKKESVNTGKANLLSNNLLELFLLLKRC